jgi:hypothetical protein
MIDRLDGDELGQGTNSRKVILLTLPRSVTCSARKDEEDEPEEKSEEDTEGQDDE